MTRFLKTLALSLRSFLCTPESLDEFRIPGDIGNRTDLCWSPDGRFFAYVRAPERNEGISRVLVFRTSDEQEVPVTDGKWNDWSPTWSRDGRSLFYVSNRGGTMDLWQQRVTETGVPEGDPLRSPWALASRTRPSPATVSSWSTRKGDQWQTSGESPYWKIVKLDGTMPSNSPLTRPTWRPRHRRCRPASGRQLGPRWKSGFVGDADSRQGHDTTDGDPTPDHAPRISPDGKRLSSFRTEAEVEISGSFLRKEGRRHG